MSDEIECISDAVTYVCFQQKEEFIKNKLQELGTMNKDGNIQRLTPEQISEFYKQFLDLKYEVHKQYNR